MILQSPTRGAGLLVRRGSAARQARAVSEGREMEKSGGDEEEVGRSHPPAQDPKPSLSGRRAVAHFLELSRANLRSRSPSRPDSPPSLSRHFLGQMEPA